MKCASKKTLAAAAFSIVAMDGSHNRGASWRGKTRKRGGSREGVDSFNPGGLFLDVLSLPFCARCVVSAEFGAPEDTKEVGAVD